MNQSRIFGLDLIRAAAVMLVLVSHLLFPLAPLGIIGVEIFFVLSGYLVGGIFLTEYTSILDYGFKDLIIFWKRRWWRTLPNYYLFLLLHALAFWLDTKTLPSFLNWVKHIFFLQNFVWRLDSFFVVSWSLTIEEWFYLLLPVAVFFFNFIPISKRHRFLAGCLLMTVFSILIRLRFCISEEWDSHLRQIALGRLDALALGCLLAYIHKYQTHIFNKLAFTRYSAFGWMLMLLVCLDFFHARILHAEYRSSDFFLTGFGILPVAGIGIFLIFPSISKLAPAPGMIRVMIEAISKWSYSIYLSHTLLIRLFEKWLAAETTSGKLLEKALSFFATFVVSALIYRYYEIRMLRMRPANPPLDLPDSKIPTISHAS